MYILLHKIVVYPYKQPTSQFWIGYIAYGENNEEQSSLVVLKMSTYFKQASAYLLYMTDY